MARKRMIDPGFWSSQEMGKLSRDARLFYIGLWNHADDEGRTKAHPSLLRSEIFPYDDVSLEFIANLKKELSKQVQWYEIKGSQYGWIKEFLDHQTINRPYPSKIPKPPAEEEKKIIKEPVITKPKPKKDKEKKIEIQSHIQTILDLFHTLTKRKYSNVSATTKFIEARLKDNSIEDCLLVVKFMHRKWTKPFPKGHTDMSLYVRPSTLFSASKFPNYLAEAKSSKEPESDNKAKDDMERLKKMNEDKKDRKKKKKDEDTF